MADNSVYSHHTHPAIEAIARRREALGLSQQAIASAAGTNQATISRLERGTADVRLSTLTEAARALAMDLRIIPADLIPIIDNLLASRTTGRDRDSGRPLYSLDEDDGDTGR
jgi:transcriptional regulator with XRE-family HTH domain